MTLERITDDREETKTMQGARDKKSQFPLPQL